jgi:hypothetical protein
LTRPKQQRAEHRAPPPVERCLLPVTPDASGTPIMMQACQNGRGGLRIIRRNAERPRTITHGSIHAREYHLSAAGPLAERAIAAAPNPPCLLQAAADQPRPRPCRQLPDSFPPGGETTAPIATSWCAPGVNKRPHSLRHWTGRQFLTLPLPQFSPLAVTFWPWCWGRLGLRRGFSARGRLQWPKS